MIRHDKLKQQIRIKGKLFIDSPIRIGGAREESPYQITDLAITRIKTKDGMVPYIPGSSLKGLVRSASEKVYKSKTKEKITCTPTSFRDSCGGNFNFKNLLKRRPNNEQISEYIERNFCEICKIFGTSGFKSHVFFTDCYPITNETFTISKKAGTSMNRRLGGTDRGALYKTEFLEPGSEFGFSLTMNNLSTEQIGLLFSAFKLINQHRLFLGSFSSRGFGKFKILFENMIPEIGEDVTEGTNRVKIPSKNGKDAEKYTEEILEIFINAWERIVQ
ncbi:MAG: CRISPR-associated RAMP protein [Candidatus Helarchaeota archaeon]|nr:CRISPR-associated RAMP protein [Candidatus Helarchaeota archaeon]